MSEIKDRSLYLVITEEYGRGRKSIDMAENAVSGGVDILQMREKEKPRRELMRLGKELCRICRKKKVKFIVNDDPVLARETDADGVHLGQEDLSAYPIKDTRKILSPDSIIGVSTHSLEQFKKVNEEDVDYIAFGPIFPTKTKNYYIGTGDVTRVLSIAKRPVFFIGGINLENVGELLSYGAKNIALIRAISEADDITAAVKCFKEKINGKKTGVYEPQNKR